MEDAMTSETEPGGPASEAASPEGAMSRTWGLQEEMGWLCPVLLTPWCGLRRLEVEE